MKKILSIASLVASLALATAAQAGQLVTNGDFSQLSNGPGLIGYGGLYGYSGNYTVATDWSSDGFVLVDQNAAATAGGITLWDAANGGTSTWDGTAPGGSNFAALDGDYYTGPLSQTINGLTVGATYVLTFNYAFSQQYGYYGDTIQSISASFGGANVFSTGDYDLPSNGFSGWSGSGTIDIVPTSTSEVLSFLAYGNLPIPPIALLTDVSLTGPGGVPEPATWGMMIIGLGVIGAAARRQRMLAIA